MSTVQLPGGHTAELREKVTIGGRDLLRAEGSEVVRLINERWPGVTDYDKLPVLEFGRELTVAFQLFNKAAVVAFLKSWTLDAVLPTMVTIDELEEEVYDPLAEAVAPLAFKAMAGSNWDPKTARDASTPTVPSTASSGGGLAPATPSTSLPTGSSPNELSSTSAPASL